MKRRKINVRTEGGIAKAELARRVRKVKEMARGDFAELNLTDDKLDKFINYILDRGLPEDELASIALQWDAQSDAVVPAQLHHNEHVIDSLMRNQYAATNFRDSASSPNYAIRHRGQSELLLRRISIGDTFLMRAAHHLSMTTALEEAPAEQTPEYWQSIWRYVLDDLTLGNTSNSADLIEAARDSGLGAVAFALGYATHVEGRSSHARLVDMFMLRGRPYFVGISARFERARRPGESSYEPAWVFHHIDEPDNLFEAAVTIFLWAVDAYYLSVQVGDRAFMPGQMIQGTVNAYLNSGRIPLAIDGTEGTDYHEGPEAWELEGRTQNPFVRRVPASSLMAQREDTYATTPDTTPTVRFDLGHDGELTERNDDDQEANEPPSEGDGGSDVQGQ